MNETQNVLVWLPFLEGKDRNEENNRGNGKEIEIHSKGVFASLERFAAKLNWKIWTPFYSLVVVVGDPLVVWGRFRSSALYDCPTTDTLR